MTNKTSVVTARLDSNTLALVDKVAKAKGRSRAWFAADAIRRVAEHEAEFLAFVQEGIDAADRGELIPHEDVMAELEEMIAKHQARCRT